MVDYDCSWSGTNGALGKSRGNISVMFLYTIAATIAIIARSTKNTVRIDAPPRNPAMNGLLAMPTSDALVSTPKPVPCAPGGITAPAALYEAVIAAPIPRPSSTDAAHITHREPDMPSSPDPSAATAAPPQMTVRLA